MFVVMSELRTSDMASCCKKKWCMGSQSIVRVTAVCPAVCDRLLTATVTATILRLCSLYAPASKTNTSHRSADQRHVCNSAVTASTGGPPSLWAKHKTVVYVCAGTKQSLASLTAHPTTQQMRDHMNCPLQCSIQACWRAVEPQVADRFRNKSW